MTVVDGRDLAMVEEGVRVVAVRQGKYEIVPKRIAERQEREGISSSVRRGLQVPRQNW